MCVTTGNNAINTKPQPNCIEQAGYREGITAGKESTLQAGFDAGYAQVGVPLGREIGLLRGTAAAFMSFIDSPRSPHSAETRTFVREELRGIIATLSTIRFPDIAPRDLEAEAHAREHLTDGEGDLPVNEFDENGIVQDSEAADRRKVELLDLEGIRSSFGNLPRPGPERDEAIRVIFAQHLVALRVRLARVARSYGLELDLD